MLIINYLLIILKTKNISPTLLICLQNKKSNQKYNKNIKKKMKNIKLTPIFKNRNKNLFLYHHNVKIKIIKNNNKINKKFYKIKINYHKLLKNNSLKAIKIKKP